MRMARNEKIREALRKWIESHPHSHRGTVPYKKTGTLAWLLKAVLCSGQWAALQGLGNQRNEQDLDILIAAAEDAGSLPCTASSP